VAEEAVEEEAEEGGVQGVRGVEGWARPQSLLRELG